MNAVDHARTASEAIRALNHATLAIGQYDAGGYQDPGEVDAVLGELATLAHRARQAMWQADRWMRHEQDAGRVRHDNGGDPASAVVLLSAHLRDAHAAAGRLADSLDAAGSVSCHLGGLLDETEEAGPS